jgi:hypothetical protein
MGLTPYVNRLQQASTRLDKIHIFSWKEVVKTVFRITIFPQPYEFQRFQHTPVGFETGNKTSLWCSRGNPVRAICFAYSKPGWQALIFPASCGNR